MAQNFVDFTKQSLLLSIVSYLLLIIIVHTYIHLFMKLIPRSNENTPKNYSFELNFIVRETG